jgi:hypothetical protein
VTSDVIGNGTPAARGSRLRRKLTIEASNAGITAPFIAEIRLAYALFSAVTAAGVRVSEPVV